MMTDDRTSYSQSLTHLIKGNLGAGLLGMGSSFSHLGLVGALIGLPFLCMISCYCVHLLVKSAQLAESKTGQARSGTDYPTVARQALELGPDWAQPFSKQLARLVDSALLVTQIGVGCVYIVFVVDNITSILASYNVKMSKSMGFIAIFPVTLLLSFIRTLKRLAVASTIANLLQFIGLALIIEYLLRDLSFDNLSARDKFRPISEMALGFGSTMFAFEGISVVLPIYSRLKQPKHMISQFGVVNISFLLILILYFIVGSLSYIKFGHNVRDSITLNLPAEPLYDAVRAMFTASILLTYPLQCYVPNEMVWKWTKKNLLRPPVAPMTIAAPPATVAAASVHLSGLAGTKKEIAQYGRTIDMGTSGQHGSNIRLAAAQLDATSLSATKGSVLKGLVQVVSSDNKNKLNIDKLVKTTSCETTKAPEELTSEKNAHHLDQFGQLKMSLDQAQQRQQQQQHKASAINDNDSNVLELDLDSESDDASLAKYEYYCRIVVVMVTFTLAVSVPKLNLLMDLIGSFSGAALSLTIPALCHLAIYWDQERGFKKCLLIVIDTTIITASLMAGLGGSLSSIVSIVRGH